jgi:hypothetical protein
MSWEEKGREREREKEREMFFISEALPKTIKSEQNLWRFLGS